MSPETFVIMIKPVGSRCNLACPYCYYLETENLFPDSGGRMSDDLLETAIRQTIEASPGPTVSFVWHGGEPTLAGLDFFRKAVKLQKQYLPANWSCWNNLQTNGLMLDDEWCSFLAEARFDVGLSLDGTSELHDSVRKDRTGHGSYQRARSAVRRLQAHGVQPDLLCTITADIARQPVDVYRALRDLQTGWIQFIPIIRRDSDGQMTSDSVSGYAYGRFLSSVFDEWIREDIGHTEIQFFAEMSLVLAGGHANVCQMSPTCGRAVVLEHDGSVFSCDHFVSPEHHIGNIRETPLGELIGSDEQHRFGLDKRDRLPRQCKVCDWLSFCCGGCLKDRFSVLPDGDSELNVLCEGFRLAFSHAEKPLRRIVELRKSGLSTDSIRSDLRAFSERALTGVGRNDPCPCGSGRKAKNCCL